MLNRLHLMKLYLMSSILLLAPVFLKAQGEIPVDMYTGRPSITIPLWAISSGDLSEPVVLSYDANSAQSKSFAGAGWRIQAGGSITRELRSFPDDVGYGLTKKGWLYNNASSVSIASDIYNFNPAADTLAGTWDAGEGTDYTKLNGFGYLVDTEPDIFNYSFGGMSGSFVIDNGLSIRTMPYADLKIEMNYLNSSDKRILGFTVTTNTGYIYTFDYKVSTTRSTSSTLYANNLFYKQTDAELYSPSVVYTREWKLTRIDSPDGAYLTFEYGATEANVGTGNGSMGLYQYPDPVYANPTDIIIANVSAASETLAGSKLLSITGSTGQKIEFAGAEILQSIKISDERRGTTDAERLIKNFAFSYQPVFNYTPNSWGSNDIVGTLQFLSSVTEYSGCERMPPYRFSYNGFQSLPYETGKFIPAIGYGIDLWGYPNGVGYNTHAFPKLYIYPNEPEAERYRIDSIPNYAGTKYILEGANRHSNTYGMITGTLGSMTSPAGGVTTFRFEGNQYLDTRTDENTMAGGLRIAAISYFDGFNPVPIKKTFEYTDPTTGLSSGRLIQRPMLAIPAYKWKSPSGSSFDKTFETSGMSAEEKWKYLTIRVAGDLTPGETTHGSTVGYKTVTVRRPGTGSARHEFLIPAIHGETVAGDWQATTNRFARYSSSDSMGIVSNGGPWMFPYSPNPNFDYERGLPWKKSEFNESGFIVKKAETTYQYLYKSGTAPYKVWGLKYGRYPGTDNSNKIFFYGKYFLLTEAQKTPRLEIVTLYDASDTTGATFMTDTTEYFYESANHKFVTKIEHTTSDGTIFSSRLTYPGDYTFATTGALDAIMIGKLKLNNRHGIPIEQIQTVKRVNDSTRVISGSVVKLDSAGWSRPFVRSTWKLKTNPPLAIENFQPSQIINSSGYKFKIDSHYERVDSILSYTTSGNVKARRSPVTRQTMVTGYGYDSTIPVVQVVNASEGQAAFSDFETTTDFKFDSSTPYYGTGRTGKNAFYPGVLLSKTISKASVNNYVLALWIKSDAAVTINIYVKNTTGSTTYYTTTLVVPSTELEFIYKQKLIPVSSAPSTFLIEIQGASLTVPPTGGSAPGLLPVIDDVFFYPETADMVATTYQFPFGATSVTAGTGITTYNEFDKLGRLRFVYDRDRNIVKRNVYQFGAESPLVADFSNPYPYTVTAGIETTFTAVINECVTDATYEWDVADGKGFVSGSFAKIDTFDTAGTYPIKLRVTSATYGTKTFSKDVYVVYSPFELEICAKGVTNFIDGAPDVIAVCEDITSTPATNGVIFKITHGLGSEVSYQWKRRDLGALVWVNVGSDSAEYPVSYKVPINISYEVMCVVTTGVYGTGNSPIKQVIYD